MSKADGFSLVLIVMMAIGGLVGWIARQESKTLRKRMRSRKSFNREGQS